MLYSTVYYCFANFSFTAVAAEPPAEPILRFDIGEHTAEISSIAADDAGRYLVTASTDKTARVWNLADGRLLSTLRIPISSGDEGQLNAVALSPDGQTVALGGSAIPDDRRCNSIYLFDRASGRLLLRITGLPVTINGLAFSPDGHLLAATLGGKFGLNLFSVTDGRLLAEDTDYGQDSYSVHFNPAASAAAAQLLTTSHDGFLRLYRFDGQRLILLAKRAAPGGARPTDARFSPDGKRIAAGFRDTPAVNVLDAAKLSLLAVLDTAGMIGTFTSVEWSLDGQNLFAAGSARKVVGERSQYFVRRWASGGLGAPMDEPVESNNTIMDLLALPGGRVAFGSSDPAWGVIDGRGQRTLFHAPQEADFRNFLQDFTLSADGTKVQFSYDNWSDSSRVFDSLNRSFLTADSEGLMPPQLIAAGLNVTDWNSTRAPKLNGVPLILEQSEKSLSLALSPDGSGFALGGAWFLHLFDRNGTQRWKQIAPGPVWAVNMTQDGRWVVAAYGDGTIRWHRASDGVEQFAFFPHADKKRWVMWTPSGYYDASPGAEDLIGWHVNHGQNREADFFPASRFREHFYRPDVLAQILQTQDETQAVHLANVAAGRNDENKSIAQSLPPVVDILSPAPDSVADSTSVTIKYRVRASADAPITTVSASINSASQANRSLKRIEDNKDVREITVTIPEEDSVIQLFAENKNGVSTPAALHLTWSAKQATPKITGGLHKGKLYALVVGVAKYKNPSYNLGLAGKDAQDFTASLQNQKGKLYGDVEVHLLTDTEATRENVLKELTWLKESPGTHDVGVLYVAGHGMNSKRGDYYFLPHDVNVDDLEHTGVSQKDIKDAFVSMLGKTVFFMDTCYSGSVLSTGNTTGLVNTLASAENGAVVFAAAAAGQTSQENEKWGNGAFTKSLVEGLSGKADFRKDGTITVKGLDFYTDDRVKSLTGGQQTPVSISPQGMSDFPFAWAK